MALTTRDKRMAQSNLTLDVPSCAFRYPALAPVAVPAPSTSASASAVAAQQGELRLSDFDRLAVLGRGNGGTVYRVSHRRTSALYALKILHRGDHAAAAEADVACRVDSPYIVRCHSVLPTASGDVALLLELVDGGSLDSLAGPGPFPEAAVAEVAAQALSGLAHLRARRVVHRDIKPANLLVSRAGQVKLADFGIAKVVSRAGDGDHCAAYEGTAAYMSPERFDTERLRDGHGDRADPYAADVWSLGVTLLELVMGRYPLLPAGQRPTWAALMCAICFGERPALPDGVASPELRGFVSACLQKDHRKRATVTELLLHPFVAGRDVAASRRELREVIELRCLFEQC
ncbi:hypothetical protein ACP70R_024608 [Stipagrostis hirtigluma subsp. patula]